MAEAKKFPGKIKIADITLPFGIAVYPHLITPDTKWKAEGEYRAKLKYTDAKIASTLTAQLEAHRDKAFEEYKGHLETAGKKAKIKSLSKADLPIKPELDEEGDETGSFLVNTKRVASGVSKKTGETWKAKIVIADAQGKVVSTKGLSIWSGTELRVKGKVMGWYNAKDNEVGVSIEIAGVQIKKLVSGGDGDVSFEALDDEDGWAAPDDVPVTDADDSDDAGEDADDGATAF